MKSDGDGKVLSAAAAAAGISSGTSTRSIRISTIDPKDLPDWEDEFTDASSIAKRSEARRREGRRKRPQKCKTTPPTDTTESPPQLLSAFESLLSSNTHASNAILLNLTVPDITSFALVSKSARGMTRDDGLWYGKFVLRWNVMPDPVWTVKESAACTKNVECNEKDDRNTNIDDDNSCSSDLEDDDGDDEKTGNSARAGSAIIPGLTDSNQFWLSCYQNAHRNPHDLWLTHWNCVMPWDGTSPGRCAMPDLKFVPDASATSADGNGDGKSAAATAAPAAASVCKDDGYDSPLLRNCPTCRHHPLLNPRLAEMEGALDAELEFASKGGAACRDAGVGAPLGNDPGAEVDPVAKSRAIAEAHSLLVRRDLVPWDNNDNDNDDNDDISRYDVSTTPAKAIFRSSLYSAAKWARNLRERDGLDLTKRLNPDWDARPMDGYLGVNDENKKDAGGDGKVAAPDRSSAVDPSIRRMQRRRAVASSAFRAASTYHRKINPNQYRSSGLQFMTDALFFNVQPTHEKVLEGSGWVGSNACPVGRRRAKEKKNNDGEGQGRQRDDEEVMSELEKALRDVYGDEVVDKNAAALPSDKAIPPPLQPNGPGTLSSRGVRHETALHTWHVARLSNPDFVRPITFRVYIQRPDCFTVYPASGYLGPGETIEITFGCRTLGSIIAEAYESIDTGREEIDTILADIYAREAHLPYAPFAIRYMFAPAPPCVPPGYKARRDQNRSSLAEAGAAPASSASTSAIGGRAMIDYLWDNVACETDVRTVYVSAHVNANYGFDEFTTRTVLPFEIWKDDGVSRARCNVSVRSEMSSKHALTFLAPNLKHACPDLFRRLNNMELETERSALGDIYRTERSCVSCGRHWGARSEELGRAFLLNRLVCDRHARIRNRQVLNAVKNLRLLPRLVEKVMASGRSERCLLFGDIYQNSFQLHAIVLSKRADRCLTCSQRHNMVVHEEFLNDILLFLQANMLDMTGLLEYFSTDTLVEKYSFELGEAARSSSDHPKLPRPWRNAGVYRYLRCTDSVFNHANVFGGGMSEPGYLEPFRNLWHNPGWYRLGIQDDPNHMDDQEMSSRDLRAKEKRFRRINWRHADVFKEDATMALTCALAMIHDPRSLLLHGIYDRSEPPGTICRRPNSDTIDAFASARAHDDQIVLCALSWIQEFEHSKREKPRFFLKTIETPVASAQRRRLERSLRSTLQQSALLGWKTVNVDLNDLDQDAMTSLVKGAVVHVSACEQYIQNVPPAGVGKSPLSVAVPPRLQSAPAGSLADAHIVVGRLVLQTVDELNAAGHLWRENTRREAVGLQTAVRGNRRGPAHQQQQDGQGQGQVNEDNANQEAVGGPRIINLLWLISSHLGWTVDDDRKPGAVLVERGILIAAQWLSNTLMALPLFLTLIARYFMMITPSPLDYHLEGLPFLELKQMRYLSADECGCAAVVVVLLYLVLGRFSERNVCRTFERGMMEQIPDPMYNESGAFQRLYSMAVLRLQRVYDSVTPLFVQNATFSPFWNRRGRRDVMDFVVQTKSTDFREHHSSFSACQGRGGGAIDSKNLHLNGTLQPNITFPMKVLIGFLVSLGSFCACSPHFSLNLITVFYSSIALGLSMSLQYMEIGNGSVSPGRIFKPMRLNVVIITAFLFGQLVGSSGGILFLAEFVVTTISLLLGGAATISTNAVESWMTFFLLSAASFFSYLIARVALVDNTRNKRGGVPSSFLLFSLIALSFLTVFACLFLEWEIPPTAMIIR